LGRLIAHPDPEQLLFRVLGLTLIAAALAKLVYVSAAVGAFLVGLALSGDIANQARTVLGPLRDLFAATFFLAIGFSVGPAALLPVLPIAGGLAVVSIVSKLGPAGMPPVARRRLARPSPGRHRPHRPR
jgi:monovalent cation:H+ antiporter-2, CPA2 family